MASAEPGSVKKKLSAEPRPVQFRKITPLAIPSPADQTRSTPPATSVPMAVNITSSIPASTPVEEQAPAVIRPETKEMPAEKTTPTPRISKLKQIRQQFTQAGLQDDLSNASPLTIESLEKEWTAFTKQLKEKKNPAAQSFENARLHLINDNTFEVSTPNNLEQKFIEQERTSLTDFLQKNLNCKQLQYSIVVNEQAAENIPDSFPPNAKEQFRNISEEYPLVKVLKEKLKLDLDY
jgi:DNA polymerase-3 subunit gamma/tau